MGLVTDVVGDGDDVKVQVQVVCGEVLCELLSHLHQGPPPGERLGVMRWAHEQLLHLQHERVMLPDFQVEQ